MDLLRTFSKDESMRTAVHNFLIAQLENGAVYSAFNHGNVTGFKEAKQLLDKAFEVLEETYADKPKPINTSTR